MNLLYILDFYVKNSLKFSLVNYDDKLEHLRFFADKPISIDTLTDYCSLRQLSGVKNATINREINIIRASVNFWNKHNDDNVKNPFSKFNLFEDDFIPRYLNEHEIYKLLSSASQYPNSFFYIYIRLLLSTGCRSGELLSLTWDNVYINDKYIVVRNSLSKNRKTVYKPLNPSSIKSFDLIDYHHYKYVFYNPKTDFHYKTFRYAWKKTLDDAGIGHLRIHDLRHTFASLLVKRGVPIYHVSQLLGHSDTRITQRYAHLSPDNLSQCVAVLPDF